MAKVEKLVACAPKERKQVSFEDFDPTRVVTATAFDRAKDPEDDDKFVIGTTEGKTEIGFMLSEAMTVPKLIVRKGTQEQAKKGDECEVNTKLLIARIGKKLQAV